MLLRLQHTGHCMQMPVYWQSTTFWNVIPYPTHIFQSVIYNMHLRRYRFITFLGLPRDIFTDGPFRCCEPSPHAREYIRYTEIRHRSPFTLHSAPSSYPRRVFFLYRIITDENHTIQCTFQSNCEISICRRQELEPRCKFMQVQRSRLGVLRKILVWMVLCIPIVGFWSFLFGGHLMLLVLMHQ